MSPSDGFFSVTLPKLSNPLAKMYYSPFAPLAVTTRYESAPASVGGDLRIRVRSC